MTRLIKEIQWTYLAPNSVSLRVDNNNGVTEICHRLAFVAKVTKIWDSTSNNEIIVWSPAKGLDKHRVHRIQLRPILFKNSLAKFHRNPISNDKMVVF